jgi:HAD superfamily hydrolase (TIGR01509 family)
MTEEQLVIFDCDGVLVDSETISNQVLAEMLTEQGIPTTLRQSRAEYQGLLLDDILARAEGKLGRPFPDGWLRQYESRRDEVFAAELRPIEGARELVESVISRGVPVCVASQGSLDKTNRSLALTGLDRLFPPHARFSARLVARGKPHPDLFLHAAATMGVDPARCVVIEDTPSGVTAAVRAAMPVYGYAADSDREALERAGARTFHSMSELSAMLWPESQLPAGQG